MGNIVWAVSRGEYSYYGIVAIMTTRELAEEYAALHSETDNIDGYRVEEFDFLDTVPEHVQVLHLSKYLGGRYGGKWDRDEITNELVSDNNPDCRLDVFFYEHSSAFSVIVYGTDFERVRKVFSEQCAQAVADPRVKFDD